ncbi:MAG: MerR family transcriptional regulator [Armatimonadota bacterium]
MVATAVAVKPSTISLSDAARELNLPEETLKRWIKAGLLSTPPSRGTESTDLLLEDIAKLRRILPPI